MTFLRTTLSNGLEILILEQHTAPVASCWIWYRVGSRNEEDSLTGISHWTEHMMFKGTERWPHGQADKAISRVGGTYNGMTWLDFTSFYASLPVQHLPLILDIEADRMHNCRISEEDVAAERPVILSERAGQENSPLFLLSEALTAAAYQVHPYGHEIVGRLEDIHTMTATDIQQHHATYYTPRNALITAAGAVNAAETAQLIASYFDAVYSAPEPPRITIVEPAQEAQRRVTLHGSGQTSYLEVAYHIPEGTHDDNYALTVLNAVLTGGSGFLVGRGSLTNHTSRLYLGLVDQEMTLDITGTMMPTIDPGLYRLTATLWPGKSRDIVESTLWEQVERLQHSIITPAELNKAQQQSRALFAYASESITYQAFWLGFSAQFTDYSWYQQYLDRIAAVTAEDVLRAAQKYLRAENRTVGWYIGDAAA
ncbi:MAG: pitrilysin family protein [Anaerolineae bacterium]|nr:pitrilysin family protein [Anaerolineae bacterium]